MEIEGVKKKNIWVFNAGAHFNGNPKWLFIYINRNRSDIDAYWLCDDKRLVDEIRGLGFKADIFASKNGEWLKSNATVYVVNQVKEHIPEEMKDAVLLNLWHGVGCKSIERKVDFGFLRERIIKKYIMYNNFYRNNQLFLVTSPLMEEHFKLQCNLDAENIIRGPYPNCVESKVTRISNIDAKSREKLNSGKKIAMYAPTYRDGDQNNFFGKAIIDMEKLHDTLVESDFILIFKLHPLMNRDNTYSQIKEKYAHFSNFLFWDDKDDIYEVFNQIDLAIIDFSSIFYDLLVAGVKQFARYILPTDTEEMRGLVFDYDEVTCGPKVTNFNEFLGLFSDYQQTEGEEVEKILDMFWSYSKETTLDDIVNQTLEFKPLQNKAQRTLYSFDIFDTLIQRKTLSFRGIFYEVKEKLKTSNIGFDEYVIENYPRIRMESEALVRDFYRKSVNLRGDARIEITYPEIFKRMQKVYNLSNDQVSFLMEQEIISEIKNCEPIQERIEFVKELLSNGEDVILISDMYLPKEVIEKLLEKADSQLLKIPLFLSSELGNQKTTKQIFFDIFNELNYDYKEWQHYGDNPLADGRSPRSLGIKTNIHPLIKFNGYENSLNRRMNTYDSFLLTNKMARFREEEFSPVEYFSYSYAPLYFVPYINWVLTDALRRDIKCLYFVSRDGHHLKRIADEIIKLNGWKIKTKYIFGSRKVWRIPSFVNELDEDFFSENGNLVNIDSFERLLQGLEITEEEFDNIFPNLSYVKSLETYEDIRSEIGPVIKGSEEYRVLLLKKAKEQREIVSDYLQQEIDFNEQHAFVEYWGRGYNQDCFSRIVKHTINNDYKSEFYYYRSIYPSYGDSVRYNYTTNRHSLIFIESIFANLPYESIEGFERNEKNILVPILQPRNHNVELHMALEKYLIKFCNDIYSIDFENREKLLRDTAQAAFDYYEDNNNKDKYILESISVLKDSVGLYETEKEFAPKIGLFDCYRYLRGQDIGTKNIQMSLARSSKMINLLYKLGKSKYTKKVYQIYYKHFRNNIKRLRKRF